LLTQLGNHDRKGVGVVFFAIVAFRILEFLAFHHLPCNIVQVVFDVTVKTSLLQAMQNRVLECNIDLCGTSDRSYDELKSLF